MGNTRYVIPFGGFSENEESLKSPFPGPDTSFDAIKALKYTVLQETKFDESYPSTVMKKTGK